MNKCRKCGTEFEGKFCPKCATPVVSQPENAAPNDEQFKICPICRQPYKGKFCPRGCGLTNGTVAKKKGLKGWQIALIVIGVVAFLGIFVGLMVSTVTDEDFMSGYSQLDEYEWGEAAKHRLKEIGVEKITDVYVKADSDNPDIIYDLKITTDKTKLNLLATKNDDGWDIFEVSDSNELDKTYYIVDYLEKDSSGRYLHNIYDYKTGELVNKADEVAVKEKQQKDKQLEEERKKEEEQRKKEDEERKEKEKQKEAQNYADNCKEIDYKELARYPDKYKGQKIKITVEIQQIMEEGILKNGGYRAYEYNIEAGDTRLEEEWFIDVTPNDGDGRILKDDVVTFYGEYSGLTEVKRALTGAKEQIPTIKVKYSQIHK